MSEHLSTVEIARLCDESLVRSQRRRAQARKVRWVYVVGFAALLVVAAVAVYVYAR